MKKHVHKSIFKNWYCGKIFKVYRNLSFHGTFLKIVIDSRSAILLKNGIKKVFSWNFAEYFRITIP